MCRCSLEQLKDLLQGLQALKKFCFIHDDLSVKRFREAKNKMEALEHIRHFGCIVYDSTVEVWEMGW